MPKPQDIRALAPDFVSAELLAFRLDCSRSTIDEYVKSGHLPKPKTIGNLVRWDFEEVRDFIRTCNASDSPKELEDPYETGVERAAPKKT